MNINQYYLYKQAGYNNVLPVADTVKMEELPAGGLGEALQKRVEEHKKQLEADRKAKLKSVLQNVYSNKYMNL